MNVVLNQFWQQKLVHMTKLFWLITLQILQTRIHSIDTKFPIKILPPSIYSGHSRHYADQVPQFNQIQYDVSGQANADVEEEILLRNNRVDPLSRADHAGYLEELTRNIRHVFGKSLQQEMDRRLELEVGTICPSDTSSSNDRYHALVWDLGYEIQTHWEACENL